MSTVSELEKAEQLFSAIKQQKLRLEIFL